MTRPESLLTPLREHSGSQTPLFCVPGAGANILSLIALANAFGKTCSVLAYQWQGLDGHDDPHSSVAAIAQDYVRALRKVQPHGPYHLLGHSFGGWVVFEMALLLRALGEEVGRLVLLDSAPPSLHGSIQQEKDPVGVMLEFALTLEDSHGQSLGITRELLQGLSQSERMLLLKARMVGQKIISPLSPQTLFAAMYRVYSTQIGMPYRPAGFFPAPMLLIEAEHNLRSPGKAQGWQQHAPMLQTSSVAASHMTMLSSPFAEEIAGIVQKKCPA